MIDSQALQQIYLSRPDLQAVYNSDGSAKNPSDPKVLGIPTLQDWANSYGIKENPQLDPSYINLSKYFTPEQINGMPPDIKTGLAAFIDVQTKNFEAGKVNADINAKNWNDAMATAASDPAIVNKYGDALKTAITTTNTALQNTTEQFKQDTATTTRQQNLDTKQLNANEDVAGRAYSGFRAQAQAKLKLDQNDIIKSSLRTLQQNVQNEVKPFETTYGTPALNELTPPANAPASYNPIGGVAGSEPLAKAADTRNLAIEFANATANPTGTK